MNKVIRKPLVSEKSSSLGELGIYSFEVDMRATKADVKLAVEKSFRVKVLSVKTANCRGRAGSRRMRAGTKKTPYWKKAMVRLVPGDKISLFEGA
jgi:large subunit ribosomal protein L23